MNLHASRGLLSVNTPLAPLPAPPPRRISQAHGAAKACKSRRRLVLPPRPSPSANHPKHPLPHWDLGGPSLSLRFSVCC